MDMPQTIHPNKLADILIGRAAFCELCKQLGQTNECKTCKVAKLTKHAIDTNNKPENE